MTFIKSLAWCSTACVIGVAALLSGCGKSPAGSGGGGASTSPSAASGTAAAGGASSSEEILVGHYASLTGAEATFGVSTDNGIKLAVTERNAAGGVKGKPVKVITYDNQGKDDETKTAVTRLIEQDHVVAVLGEVASGRSQLGAPICQKKGVPMITPSSTNPRVTKEGDMIFRVCFIDPFQGFVGAKFAKENLGLTKAATLYNRQQPYSDGLNQNFVESFKRLGGQVLTVEAYSTGDNDFSSQLTSIREAKPDFIYVPGYYTEVVNIARQARRLDIKVPLIGGDGWDSEELKNAGDALNGCYFSNHYAPEDTRPEVQTFVKKYQAEFGKVPDGLAALGYDAALVLFDAMDRSPSMSGKDLAAAIAATRDFTGVTGRISIDDQRNPTKDAVVVEVVNGVPRFKATIKPE
jgi:branched-chain amino acid transport system substrate-binding protein